MKTIVCSDQECRTKLAFLLKSASATVKATGNSRNTLHLRISGPPAYTFRNTYVAAQQHQRLAAANSNELVSILASAATEESTTARSNAKTPSTVHLLAGVRKWSEKSASDSVCRSWLLEE
jgi:hypothetical protein